MSELGKRVAVSVVGIPIVLGVVFVGGWWLAALLAAFAVLGTAELYRIGAAVGVRPFTAVGAPAAGAMVLVTTRLPSYTMAAPWLLGILAVVALVLVVASLFLRSSAERPLGSVAVTLFGMLYVGLPLAVVPLLHALPDLAGWVGPGGNPASGLIAIAVPLASTWMGDASAFFAGKAWGRAKLAPSISPNKSWVGFWAGLGGAALAAVVWYVVGGSRLPAMPIGVVSSAAIGALLGLGAVAGDLVESLLKREAGLKDSGTFFPGHGGVLDRLDALVVTIPLAYVVLSLTGTLT